MAISASSGDTRPKHVEQFRDEVDGFRSTEEYQDPAAFAVGVATISGRNGESLALDTYFPVVNVDENHRTAAVLAEVVGHRSGSATYAVSAEQLATAVGRFGPFESERSEHPNLDAMHALQLARYGEVSEVGTHKRVVVTFIGSLDAPPVDIHDVYLRLHILSHRKVQPHGLNLDGVFGLLPNVVWSNMGPCDPATFEAARSRLRALGTPVTVHSLDKFPRMTDYVIPSGVRIADASRVRLGAHLAAGTTVMHEGFVNFNAGTLGTAMVEGRITAGVVVGDGTDLGGGSSILGTLSGGGKEVITIGRRCLIGANAGTGISLGDGCIVEAGLYLTAGTLVTTEDGKVQKARELSGATGLLYRRNSVTGTVEAVTRAESTWAEGLNAELHTGQ